MLLDVIRGGKKASMSMRNFQLCVNAWSASRMQAVGGTSPSVADRTFDLADNVEPSFRLVGNTDSSGLVRNITQVQAESQPGETPVYYETINFPAFPAFPAYQPSGIYYGGLSTEQLYGNSQFAYINNYTLSQYAIAVSPASMNGTDINVQYQFVSMASGVAQNVTFITKVASSALNSFC